MRGSWCGQLVLWTREDRPSPKEGQGQYSVEDTKTHAVLFAVDADTTGKLGYETTEGETSLI
jgi:hypothetical protein